MNTRFDVGDKAYCEVTIIGISINEDGVRYLVRADNDTFITIDEHLREADISGNTVGGMVKPDKDKVSNLLCNIYSIQSVHLNSIGVVTKKYYCEELWKELFGKESELPDWLLASGDGFESCDVEETPFGGNDHGKSD